MLLSLKHFKPEFSFEDGLTYPNLTFFVQSIIRSEDGMPAVAVVGGATGSGLEVWQSWDETVVDKAVHLTLETMNNGNIFRCK